MADTPAHAKVPSATGEASEEAVVDDHVNSSSASADVRDVVSDASTAAKKKKKKKKKKAAGSTASGGDDGEADTAALVDDGDSSLSGKGGTDVNKELARLLRAGAGGDASSNGQSAELQKMIAATISQLQAPQPKNEDPTTKDHKFWKTQPVPQWTEEDIGSDNSEVTEGVLEADKDQSELRQTPLNLPAGFEWYSLNLDDAEDLDALYKLLNENYVEDDDNMFRFDYSREFLIWALQPPGWKKVWHCGVRGTKNKNLLGFISAVPATLRMREHSQKLVEINFLCVHKKLRTKRLAPVLIQEITRRVNCEGLFQAVYTAGHRSLDPKKLIDVRFSYLPRDMTMAKLIRKLRVPSEPATPGLRAMVPADVPKASALVRTYLAKFTMAPIFDEEDFAHWLLPRSNVINTYVVENSETHEITDFISFYTLPSTIVNHPRHKLLKAAYCFYNVATSTTLTKLMRDALILAKNERFDVFNALDLMHNSEFLEELHFGGGDGNLQYYLYNYRLAQAPSNEIGLVLL